MKLIHFGIVIVSFFMIFTTGFAFGDQPVGQRTIAKGEGEWCMSQEPTSWIKERLGESGCVKVGYTVPPECNNGQTNGEVRRECLIVSLLQHQLHHRCQLQYQYQHQHLLLQQYMILLNQHLHQCQCNLHKKMTIQFQ